MDELQRSLLNVFTCCDLDREADARKDLPRIAAYQCQAASRYLLFSGDRYLAQADAQYAPVMASKAQLTQLCSLKQAIYLGARAAHRVFSIEVNDQKISREQFAGPVQFAGLREYGARLSVEDATLIAYGKAMIHWHQAHRFCGVCGAATQMVQSGHARKCLNADCAVSHFPRIDPAIIVQVTYKDKCLFGRQAKWPPHRYSVIAGFVEPGESVEQAVVREVLEETNIRLSRVHYHSSQPWPFPSSIMLGFTASASTFEIELNDQELEDAHWRSTDEVAAGLQDGTFLLPPRLSIAYRLIEDWFNARSAVRLHAVLESASIARKG